MDLQKRIRMNTESLQQAFPEVYRTFFSKCATVISAPGTFYVSSGLSVLYGGAGIMDKLPIRIYVGLERDGLKTLKFGEYLNFVPHQQQFEFSYHDKVLEAHLVKLLHDLQKDLPSPIHGKIHVLSEIPIGTGLNFFGAMSIAIATLLFMEAGVLDAANLARIVTAKTPEVLKDPLFDKLLRFAWKLEACSDNSAGSGSAPFASFFESTSPIAFFPERRQGTFAHHPYSRVPVTVDSHYEVFDTIQYAGFRLKDLYNWLGDPSWPVDYGLLYLGQQKNAGSYLKPMRVVQEGLDDLEKLSDGLLKQFPESLPNVRPAFTDMTQSAGKRGYWEDSVDFLIMLSVKALFDLKTLIENGTNESLDELVNTVMLQDKIFEFFTHGLPSSSERDSLSKLKHALNDKTANGLHSIRLLPDRGDGGGDMLFIAPQGYLQDNTESLLMLLRSHISPLVRIDYMSWLDGDEYGGVRLEQQLSSSTFSSYVSKGTTKVMEWRGDTKPVTQMFTSTALAAAIASYDIFFDDIEHKIYVQGTLLNSTKLKSARATIHIWKMLLEHYGQDVQARALPPSAYIERNEMQSKIVTPLSTAYREKTGKKLPWQLHGGLMKDFAIRILPNTITIGLLTQ